MNHSAQRLTTWSTLKRAATIGTMAPQSGSVGMVGRDPVDGFMQCALK